MRRGLIAWSKEELPEAVLDARVAALQAAMVRDGLDAVAVYTTPARAAAVAWLAGFVPYWNQGLLVVPREGRPVLVSALSNRVNGWMRRNAHVADVRNSPRIGSEAGKHVTSTLGKGVVGIVDQPHLPAPVIADIVAEGHRVSDATALLRGLRWPADAADLALHERAARITGTAISSIDPRETNGARLVARIDGEARRLGAEEVYPALAADLEKSRRLVRLEGTVELGELWALRLSVAYKGTWVRVTQTIARDASRGEKIGRAQERFAQMAVQLPDTRELSSASSWLVEGTRTALPLEPLAGSMLAEAEPLALGSVVSAQATIEIDGVPVLVGAPLVLAEGGARLLLSS